MLTIVWSTPRTGSTWYSQYLYQQLNTDRAVFLKQFLNQWHMNSYGKRGNSDLLYAFEPGAMFEDWYLEPLSNKIKSRLKFTERTKSLEQEELHRINLIEKHNFEKYPIVMHHHINPMTERAYRYLKNKASINIFLYRESLIDQLASYVVAISQQKFVLAPNEKPVAITNAEIPLHHLEHIYDRIRDWYRLDKTDCEVVKYEDLDFSVSNHTQKQNVVKPIDQVSETMRLKIYELNEHFTFFRKNKIA